MVTDYMKLPSLQFYPADWRKDPGVQSLSYHDRGVWFEILCLMHESEQRGKLLLNGKAMPEDALARLLGLDKQIVTKTLTTLLEYGVASVDQESGALVCRRMVRDEELRKIRQEAGKMGGNPALLKQNPKQEATTEDKQKTTPSSSSSITSSSSKEKKVIEKKPKDERANHPAIVACRQLTQTYPKKELWDGLISALGESPDLEKLKTNRVEWLKRGFNPNAWTWALDWYASGVPERWKNGVAQNGNSSNKSNDAAGKTRAEVPGDCGFQPSGGYI